MLWHVLKPATARTIAAAPRLRLIQKIGVGVNTIDLKAAQARGIPVCNLPGTNAQAVAEMTLLLMLQPCGAYRCSTPRPRPVPASASIRCALMGWRSVRAGRRLGWIRRDSPGARARARGTRCPA